MSDIPPKRRRAYGTPLLLVGIILGTAGVGFGAAWLTSNLIKRLEPDTVATGKGPARDEAATVFFEMPNDIMPEMLKLGVFQGSSPAKAVDGTSLAQTNGEKLAKLGLAPGEYIFRIKYRERPLPELKVELKRGERRLLSPSYSRMAEAEYAAGLRAAERDGDQDVPYFQRVLALDPDHVEAHFQLAAYALSEGSAAEVADHLTALRRLAPKDPRLKEVEKRYQRLK